MKKLLTIAGLALLLFSAVGFAQACTVDTDCQSGYICNNQTWTCQITPEEQARLDSMARQLKQAQDCPAPPTDGCKRVTFMASDIPVKNKVYMYVCNGEGSSKLANQMNGYEFVSSRGSRWTWQKYRYIGA